MPSTLAANPESKITMVNSPIIKEVACLWAATIGGAKLKREINFEICGSEGVTLSGSDKHTFDILYRNEDAKIAFGGNNDRHVHIDLSIFNSRFISNSPVDCPIS